MCGLVGGWLTTPDREALAESLRSIGHRGPDDRGEYLSSATGVVLGHVRLSILDLSVSGHQPMLSDDGGVALVFNGEIYNFRELRSELEVKGHRFRGQSDTEVVLQLYLAEGESMLRRMNGIFALAIWDTRNQSLLVARDALGVKPLYFASTRQGVAFASEIKALLSLLPELRELDAPALHRYLSFLWCPGEGTPFKAVRKLLPGEAMTIKNRSVTRRWQWYRLPCFQTKSLGPSRQAAVAGIAQNIRQAVHRQMVADVPVGAFLSGGLDSSSVVAFAREQNPNVRCFTMEFSGPQELGMTDDLPYAHRVAKHLRVPLDVVQVDAGTMAGDLERMVWQLDEPLADPAALNVMYISQLARQQGIKVLLSGAGGDDLFTGYRRHLAVNYEYLWRWLPARLRQAMGQCTQVLDQRNPLFRRITKLTHGMALADDERVANYFSWSREDDIRALYTADFRAGLADIRAADPLLDFIRPLPEQINALERMLALEQRFFLSDHNLNYTDKMSMAAGVEVRVPLLDLEVVDYASRVPIRFKQRGREGKWVFKKAMEPYLPKDVIYRPKSGFGAPLRRWMRCELRPLLNDLLSTEGLKRRGIFDPTAVHKLMANNDAGKIDASYTLLSVLCIEIWCHRFLDRNPARN